MFDDNLWMIIYCQRQAALFAKTYTGGNKMNIDPKLTKKIASALAGIIAIIILIAIWDQWNEIWYHFGENIYNLIHK